MFVGLPGKARRLIAHLDRYVIREDVQLRDTTAERSYLLIAGGATARSTCCLARIDRHREFVATAAGECGRKVVDTPVRWIHWTIWTSVCWTDRDRGLTIRRRDDASTNVRHASATIRVRHDADRSRHAAVRRRFRRAQFAAGGRPRRAGDQLHQRLLLGQETVARIDALGHVNQQIVGVRFRAADVPAVGTELTHGGADVGRVTSAAFSPRSVGRWHWRWCGAKHNAVGTQARISRSAQCEVVALPCHASARGELAIDRPSCVGQPFPHAAEHIGICRHLADDVDNVLASSSAAKSRKSIDSLLHETRSARRRVNSRLSN